MIIIIIVKTPEVPRGNGGAADDAPGPSGDPGAVVRCVCMYVCMYIYIYIYYLFIYIERER